MNIYIPDAWRKAADEAEKQGIELSVIGKQPKPRVLALCEGGVVRSACLSTILRWDFGVPAVALSGAKSGQEEIDLLSEWSTVIVIMWKEAANRILSKHAHKILFFDIGPDVWRNPMHPELLKIVGEQCQKWKDSGWRL